MGDPIPIPGSGQSLTSPVQFAYPTIRASNMLLLWLLLHGFKRPSRLSSDSLGGGKI